MEYYLFQIDDFWKLFFFYQLILFSIVFLDVLFKESIISFLSLRLIIFLFEGKMLVLLFLDISSDILILYLFGILINEFFSLFIAVWLFGLIISFISFVFKLIIFFFFFIFSLKISLNKSSILLFLILVLVLLLTESIGVLLISDRWLLKTILLLSINFIFHCFSWCVI